MESFSFELSSSIQYCWPLSILKLGLPFVSDSPPCRLSSASPEHSQIPLRIPEAVFLKDGCSLSSLPWPFALLALCVLLNVLFSAPGFRYHSEEDSPISLFLGHLSGELTAPRPFLPRRLSGNSDPTSHQ